MARNVIAWPQPKVRRRGLRVPFWLALFLSFGLGVGGMALIGSTGLPSAVLDLADDLAMPKGSSAALVTARFDLCSGPVRITCVVDGDTIWFEGTKIRIADLNTPEIGQPDCAAEAALGRQATTRLMQILNSGAFEVRTAYADRDADQYGRKLRLVYRNGVSVSEQLIAEGLAHEWRGRRESWC